MVDIFEDGSLKDVRSMDIFYPCPRQPRHIAFDWLESHTRLSYQTSQQIDTIDILLKFLYILNLTKANTVVSKKSYFKIYTCRIIIYF